MLTRLILIGLILFEGPALYAQSKAIAQAYQTKDLFITRHNGSYGLKTDSAAVFESPRGDSICILGDNYFAVRTNKRYSIVDHSLHVLAERVIDFKYIGSSLFLKDSAGWFCKELAMRFDSVAFYQNRIWLYKNTKVAIYTPEANKLSEWHDAIGIYLNGLLFIRNNTLGWQGHFSLPTEYDHIYLQSPSILTATKGSDNFYFHLETGKALNCGPRDSLVVYDYLYKTVRKNAQAIYNFDNKLLLTSSEYEIHPYEFDVKNTLPIFVATRNDSCALIFNGLVTPFKYKNFLPSVPGDSLYIRSVEKTGVGAVNLQGKELIDAKYSDILDYSSGFFIVRKGSNLGLQKAGDQEVLPCSYKDILFVNKQYVAMSDASKLYAIYNLKTKRIVCDFKYKKFNGDSVFMLAQTGEKEDMYFRDSLVEENLVNTLCNGNSFKGYRAGEIIIGSNNNGSYERYAYQIPSYKVENAELSFYGYDGRRYRVESHEYDYAKSKWGKFNYSSQTWADQPIAHSGIRTYAGRLLEFRKDTLLSWQGISFKVRGRLAELSDAWQKEQPYYWVDGRSFGIISEVQRNTRTSITPIGYSKPGKGYSQVLDYKPILHVYEGGWHDVLVEGGSLDLASTGDLPLHEYYTSFAAAGNTHPATIADYMAISRPNTFVKFSNAKEHVLSNYNNDKSYIKHYRRFDYIEKYHSFPMIYKEGANYGLINSDGADALTPSYLNAERLWVGTRSVIVFAEASETGSIYNPLTHKLSAPIKHIKQCKGGLLVLKVNQNQNAVVTVALDTVLITGDSIALAGNYYFYSLNGSRGHLYQKSQAVFDFFGTKVESVDKRHFIIYNYSTNTLVNAKRDTIYHGSDNIQIKQFGAKYLLTIKGTTTVLDSSDKVLFTFRAPFITNARNDLAVKTKDSVFLLKAEASTVVGMVGKFRNWTKHYIVVKLQDKKAAYDFEGKLLVSKTKQIRSLSEHQLSYQKGKHFYHLDVKSKQQTKISKLSQTIESEEEEVLDSVSVVKPAVADSVEIVLKEGRYGLASRGKLLLPAAYYGIQALDTCYLVRDQYRYKLYDVKENKYITLKPCDKVLVYRNYCVTISGEDFIYIPIPQDNRSFNR